MCWRPTISALIFQLAGFGLGFAFRFKLLLLFAKTGRLRFTYASVPSGEQRAT